MYSTMIECRVNPEKIEGLRNFRSSDIKPLGIINTPPANPSDGDIYAIGDVPSAEVFGDLAGMVVKYNATDASWTMILETAKGDVLEFANIPIPDHYKTK